MPLLARGRRKGRYRKQLLLWHGLPRTEFTLIDWYIGSFVPCASGLERSYSWVLECVDCFIADYDNVAVTRPTSGLCRYRRLFDTEARGSVLYSDVSPPEIVDVTGGTYYPYMPQGLGACSIMPPGAAQRASRFTSRHSETTDQRIARQVFLLFRSTTTCDADFVDVNFAFVVLRG
jgi:hypothetical protein